MEQPSQQNPTWPCKYIWKCRIPYKVSCVTWLLAKEVTLTQDNIMERVIMLFSRCSLCGETSESVKHLFPYCKYTPQLWRVFFSLEGISWTMPRRVTKALKTWEEADVHSKDRVRWKIIPTSIWWAIRKERNSRCFESIENIVHKVKLDCILLLCFWCNQ